MYAEDIALWMQGIRYDSVNGEGYRGSEKARTPSAFRSDPMNQVGAIFASCKSNQLDNDSQHFQETQAGRDYSQGLISPAIRKLPQQCSH
jgi:hypothetical protein